MGKDHHHHHHHHHHSRSHSHKRDRDESRSRTRDESHRRQDPSNMLYDETPERKRRHEEEEKESNSSERRDVLLSSSSGQTTAAAAPAGPKPFVWDKKVKDMKEKGLDYKKYLKDAKSGAAVAQLQEEKERIRKAREEREQERELIEAERARKRRLEAQADAGDIEMSEEEFQLRQATKRAQIRAALGKARPVDRIYLTVHSEDKPGDKGDNDNIVPVHMRYNEDPVFVVERCGPSDLVEVQRSVQGFVFADADDPAKKEFWENLLILCDDKADRIEREYRAARRSSVCEGGNDDEECGGGSANASTRAKNEALKVFESKNSSELEKLCVQIAAKRSSAANFEYWDFLYRKIVLFLARAKVREYYSALLDRLGKANSSELALQQITQACRDVKFKAEDADIPKESGNTEKENPSKDDENVEDKDNDDGDGGGGMSPALIEEGEEGEEVVDPENDAKELSKARRDITEREARVLSSKPELFSETVSVVPEINANATSVSSLQGLTASVAAAGWMTEDQMYNVEASRGLEEDESVFNSTVALSADQQVQLWHDKFRPRKPRFFNRIHAGFAWSKFNKAHYDPENPPPKVVQGYKFNVFYPDLIDKTQVPSFFVEKDPENPEDFCILRIHAGPPYEDIAFRIVNREWEMSYRKGFKCVFDRGVFHLWFNFKKYKYRR